MPEEPSSYPPGSFGMVNCLLPILMFALGAAGYHLGARHGAGWALLGMLGGAFLAVSVMGILLAVVALAILAGERARRS